MKLLHWRHGWLILVLSSSVLVFLTWKGLTKLLVNEQEAVRVFTDTLAKSSTVAERAGTQVEAGLSGLTKHLIYTCRLDQYCGGLSDRIRGIVHAFILAGITRRRFGIIMELPGCELSSMLNVSYLDWRVNVASLEESKLTSLVYNRVNSIDVRDEFRKLDFNAYFREDVVYYTSNQLLFRFLFANPHHVADVGWLTAIPQGELFRAVMAILFTLAPPLQTQVDTVTTQVNTSPGGGLLVAAQIRCGRNPSIPDDTQVRLTSEGLKVIWAFLRKYESLPAARFFVSSDSESVMQEARSIFGKRLLEVPGPIVHLAYPRNDQDVCAGMQRVLVDMHVLAASDVLLLTHSGIGDLAMHLRGRSKGGLFCFHSESSSVTGMNMNIKQLCR